MIFFNNILRSSTQISQFVAAHLKTEDRGFFFIIMDFHHYDIIS